MSGKRRIFLWSIALSLPVQYLVLAVISFGQGPLAGSVYGRPDTRFACHNFHSSMHPCGLAEMLLNNLFALVLLDVATFGAAFALTAGLVAAVLLILEKAKERSEARDRRHWL
jgi:hypothetical protein